jgi:hypothetical protein
MLTVSGDFVKVTVSVTVLDLESVSETERVSVRV